MSADDSVVVAGCCLASDELEAAHVREDALATELGRARAEISELQAKLHKATAALKNAKVTAREALIEMADQNARLVQAFVDKKRECKQLKAAAREDRKAWQQRLQGMEQELQSNKQHIKQLMQQLHAIAARQVPSPQAAPGVWGGAAVQRARSRVSTPATDSSSNSGSASRGSPAVSSSSTVSRQQEEVSSQRRDQQPQQQQQQQSNVSPLGDATNRVDHCSRIWQQSSAAKRASSLSSKLRSLDLNQDAAAQEDALNAASRQAQAAGTLQQQALQQQEPLLPCEQQLLQQQEGGQQELVGIQQQMRELQQRSQQLEAENAELRSAQAAAAAQIDHLKLTQQAEQLKQQGNRHFQAQEFKQAAAAYSQALALSPQDAALTAVLLCNRAAAQHAAGNFLDAIADCCLAHQLDPNNQRALQRRAEAYIAVQHYGAAVADLQKLLEQASSGSSSSSKDVAARLASAQAKQRAHGTLGPQHYTILGLEGGASAADVKAAYKKLALKHHPDKAVGPEAKAAAEAVFVLITAANAVLSDPSKRAAYDAALARHTLLYGGVPSSSSIYTGSSGSSSSRHYAASSTGAGMYGWQQQHSTSFAAAQQAAQQAARAATAAAAAAAAAGARQQTHWQQSTFRAPGGSAAMPADSSNSANSSTSCTSGTYARHTTSMRL